MIESRAQVVDAVANDCAPCWRDGFALSEAIDFVSSVRFLVDLNVERIAGLKSGNRRSDVYKVLFGPVNLMRALLKGLDIASFIPRKTNRSRSRLWIPILPSEQMGREGISSTKAGPVQTSRALVPGAVGSLLDLGLLRKVFCTTRQWPWCH
jgi:hypothetical protein